MPVTTAASQPVGASMPRPSLREKYLPRALKSCSNRILRRDGPRYRSARPGTAGFTNHFESKEAFASNLIRYFAMVQQNITKTRNDLVSPHRLRRGSIFS